MKGEREVKTLLLSHFCTADQSLHECRTITEMALHSLLTPTLLVGPCWKSYSTIRQAVLREYTNPLTGYFSYGYGSWLLQNCVL